MWSTTNWRFRSTRGTRLVWRVKDLRSRQKTGIRVLDVGHRFGLKGGALFPDRDETGDGVLGPQGPAGDGSGHDSRVGCISQVWGQEHTYTSCRRLRIPSGSLESAARGAARSLLEVPLAIKPAGEEHFFYATGDSVASGSARAVHAVEAADAQHR